MGDDAVPADSSVIAPAWQQAAGKPFSASGYAKTSRVLSDQIVFVIDQTDRYLQAQVLCSPPPLYRYDFQWQNEPQPWRDIFGSEHAMDVPFLFGNFNRPSFLGYAYTPANQPDRDDLSKLMNTYFANFLWNGNPNETSGNPSPYTGAPQWSAWTDIVTLKKRMLLNASLGKADAGSVSHMSNAEELAAPADLLSLPPVGYAYAKSFLESFVPQDWLSKIGLHLP